MSAPFDARPIVVALEGSNGAGKTTFYHAHLQPAGLRFVNANELARELDLNPYSAAKVAEALRRELVQQRESFVFETVFSDPVGDKRAFLRETMLAGYTVVLCFIGISGPEISEERVAIRVSPGRPRRAERETHRPLPSHPGQSTGRTSRTSAHSDL